MTTMIAYDPALCERLEAEAREDDARMEPAPWTCVGHDLTDDDAAGILRQRNNLAAMADQLQAARAEVERLEVLVEVKPDDIKSVVAENDRMHAAFSQAIATLRTPGAKVSSAVCTWCGQHWPKLDGESYEMVRTYTNKHAEACPANDIRIERDALRAEIGRLGREQTTAAAVARGVIDSGNEAFRQQRDRWTAERDALRDQLEHAIGERDRLRSDVSTYRQMYTDAFGTQDAENDRLRAEVKAMLSVLDAAQAQLRAIVTALAAPPETERDPAAEAAAAVYREPR